MFDLELDTSKNQYETGQSAAASAEKDQQKAIDDAFERLQMLARRQQELADQKAQQQSFEQRWQEEQLRREAEELRQQIQQLAQNSQGQQQSNSSQQRSSQSSSSSASQGSQQGSQQSGQMSRANSSSQNQQMSEALRQTMKSLESAEDQMRQAVSGHDATAQQRAASQLRAAQDILNRTLHQQADSSVADLAQRAQEIANAQKGLADEMKRMYGDRSANPGRRMLQPGGMSSEASSGGEDGMQEMNDPNSVRFGYGFRRHNWQQEMEPRRPATDQEKALASDKEKLGQRLEQLEHGVQQQAQNMAGSRPEVASKLRRALSEAEQKELALRMQKGAEWMRQGYGDRNVGMEDGVTAGVEQLSQQLRDVERDVASGQQENGMSDKTAEELSRVRALREELERATQSNGQPGDGQQTGQQAGGRAYGQIGGEGPVISRQNLQDAIGQLQALRAQVNPRDRELFGYINGAIGNMEHLTGAEAGLLDSRLSRDAVVSLERLEVELNKRAVEQHADGTRTGAPEASPEKYRDAVAEYFKKLSK